MSQQTEQLPQVWGVFFCSQHCHRHTHTALRSQTDLQLFGELAPAYLSTPCVVCVCSQLLPSRSCWELSSACSWYRSSNPAAHTSGRVPAARALQVIAATQSEPGRLSHLELTGSASSTKPVLCPDSGWAGSEGLGWLRHTWAARDPCAGHTCSVAGLGAAWGPQCQKDTKLCRSIQGGMSAQGFSVLPHSRAPTSTPLHSCSPQAAA